MVATSVSTGPSIGPSTGDDAARRATIADAVIALAADLRAAGVGTSTSDTIEAVAATAHVGVASRPLLRAALQATMVARAEDLDVFAVLFERHFPPTPDMSPLSPRSGLSPSSPSSGESPASPASRESHARSLVDRIGDALVGADDAALAELAFAAVDAHAGIGQDAGGERYFVYRVVRAIDLANLIVAAMAQLEREDSDVTDATRRHRRDDLRARAARYRALIEAAVRARLAGCGAQHEADAEALAQGPKLERDIIGASTTELRQMRDAVRPLARRLASRIGRRRRRHRRGRLDVRRTIRRSLSAGGTPLDPAFRRPHPTKPQVVVLCDISGSVAEFARFTMLLLDALHDELASLRVFVFVDGVAELTAMLARADETLDPRLLARLPAVTASDGHSDYGRAMARFVDRHGDAISPTTTVVVTGDARTNNRGSGAAALRQISDGCRKLYWLNPEPAAEWGRGDSAVAELADIVDAMFEVRNLAQLAAAVESIV